MARILLPVKFLTPNLKSPWGCFLFEYEIWWGLCQDLYVFERKTASVMQNFQNLEAGGGGGDHFLTKPPKGTSLPDFTRFEQLCMRIRSRVFPPGVTTKKRDTTKSHRDVIFHLFAGNSPLNQI